MSIELTPLEAERFAQIKKGGPALRTGAGAQTSAQKRHIFKTTLVKTGNIKYSSEKAEISTRTGHRLARGMCTDYTTDNVKRYELYRNGLNDVEIAEEIGIDRSAIQQWRKKNNYPANITSKRIDYGEVERLYNNGLNDPKIAKILKCSVQSVYRWRRRNGLAKRIDYGEVEKLYNDGLNDPKIAKILKCSVKSVYRWRRRNGLAPNAKKTKNVFIS